MKANSNWTAEEIAWLKENFTTSTNKELCAHLGKTWWPIYKMQKQLGLKKTERWEPETLAWIKANAHLGQRGLAEALNVPLKRVETVLNNHKILTGNDSRFKNGMNPWNAGKKIRMSPKSEFRKGMQPHNTLHDGAITIRHEKNGTPYKYIRIAKAKWDLLHRHVWMKANGPIPKDSLIIFRDGNTMNCELHNLQCITKRANMERNRNRPKQAASLAEVWENGSRYENDQWIARLIAGQDKELQAELLQNKELIEAKRQQLLLNRKIKDNAKVKPQDFAAQPQ